ncbi:MAG: DUF3090 family protein [Acidimicrobiales bacterium]
MSESYDFRHVTHFTAGTEGRPGQRVFYLQVGDETGHVSVRLEKQQVQALAQFLRSVLDELPSPGGVRDDPVPMIEPALAAWTVGQIAVGIDEADGEVVLVVDELVPEEDDPDHDDPLAPVSDGARIRAFINADQASRFIATSEQLMAGGRPPCRLCGQPLDPDGHNCPRLN